MDEVCEKTVRNRSMKEKRPLSVPDIIPIDHSCFVDRGDTTLKTPFRNRN